MTIERSKKRKNGVIVDCCPECNDWWVRDTKNYKNWCPVCRIDLLPQKSRENFNSEGIERKSKDWHQIGYDTLKEAKKAIEDFYGVEHMEKKANS